MSEFAPYIGEDWDELERDPLGEEREALEALTIWRYDPKYKVIEAGPGGYWIPTNRLNTNAEIVDWLCQIAKKNVPNMPQIVGELAIAFNALLDPQAHMCGCGIDQGKVDAEELAEGRYATMIKGNPDSVLVTRLKERP